MDLLEQGFERIAVVDAGSHRPLLKRTTKGGGNPGLFRQDIDTDHSTFHMIFARRLFR